jgi:hypothetical protein
MAYSRPVTPAKAGVQSRSSRDSKNWIPAFAGMTVPDYLECDKKSGNWHQIQKRQALQPALFAFKKSYSFDASSQLICSAPIQISCPTVWIPWIPE